MATISDDSHRGILNVGSHCHTCNNIDFLPFKCDECGHEFCSTHRTPESHGCLRSQKTRPLNKDTKLHSAIASSSPSPSLSSPSSSSSSSTPRSAPGLAGAAAASRAAAAKSPSPSPQQPKASPAKLAALERLRNFLGDKNKNKSKTAKPVKNSKSSAMALFDLKRAALGDASIPTNLRIYVYVTRPATEYTDAISGKQEVRPEKTKALFFSRDWPVGRVLDIACTKLEVTNVNNRDANNRVALFNGKSPLTYGAKFGDVVKDGATLVVDKLEN
uniref:ARAD1C31108p n=1 Tax=Blastobotrys adeninivorans TaxID=409370 RepID=A0A060T2E8_BLAAD